jgi:hypothetical protein
MARANRVAELNDAMRQGRSNGGWTVTAGVNSLGSLFVAQCLQAVQTFADFTLDNDPYGEHDFGSFTVNDYKLFWKIDYYDLDVEMGSPDPTDPSITKRIITIMLASEY